MTKLMAEEFSFSEEKNRYHSAFKLALWKTHFEKIVFQTFPQKLLRFGEKTYPNA